MLFSSFAYVLAFFPLTIFLTIAAKRFLGIRAAQACVLLCSIYFYCYFGLLSFPYLLGSVLANWAIGKWIDASEGAGRKRVLQLGLILNIAFLCTFKYLNLFLGSIPWLAHHGLMIPDLKMPLGVSFFTISQIMYLVDCYEKMMPASTLFDHATFATFFPYVISGPISRSKRITHQFHQLGGRQGHHASDMARGMYLFSLGLFKKVFFANGFSLAVDAGFSQSASLSVVEAWFFPACYALQIYFDFSGYSDMAIGSALMLGIQLPPNFDNPLSSKSIIEFWQRWHISLTNFITTYLYTPFLRLFNRPTLEASMFSTLLAMTIAGLWHGASWTFVIFGMIHGAALAINQYWRKKKLPKMPVFVAWLLTMAVVAMGFVFFHALNLNEAMQYIPHMVDYRHLFGVNVIRNMDDGLGVRRPIVIVMQLVGVYVAFFGKSSEARARDFQPTYGTYAITVSLTLSAWLYMNSNFAKPFIYFGF